MLCMLSFVLHAATRRGQIFALNFWSTMAQLSYMFRQASITHRILCCNENFKQAMCEPHSWFMDYKVDEAR